MPSFENATMPHSMQQIVLEPLPKSLPNDVVLGHLSRNEVVAIVATSLEQHEEEIKDMIREIALCEMEYADKETAENPLLQRSRQEPRPDAFQVALRSSWKRHVRKKPVVRRKQRSQPVFHIRTTVDHIGTTRKAVERLDDYGRLMKSTLVSVREVSKRRAPVSLASPVVPAPQPIAPERHYDASRDPRRRDSRP